MRIGTSAAKGICAGLGLPLVAPSPLQALRHRASSTPSLADQTDRILPAIDARRMEMFTLGRRGNARRRHRGRGLPCRPRHRTRPAHRRWRRKCADVLRRPPCEWTCAHASPSAEDLIPESHPLLAAGRTGNVADYEPFYLKDFVPGRPKDPLGLRTPTP